MYNLEDLKDLKDQLDEIEQELELRGLELSDIPLQHNRVDNISLLDVAIYNNSGFEYAKIEIE